MSVVPVRFATIEVGPDRRRTLEVARALRAAGIRVEHVTATSLVVRAEDEQRAEGVAAGVPEA